MTASFYINFHPFRKCVNYGCTYTVKSAGYFVSSAAKLTACMKDCIHNFNSRFSCLMIDIYRNTSTIIYYCY